MKIKKILVLVMTFAMLLSAFAPTLGVFAEAGHAHDENDAKGTLNYVSIGDSMTNGYGFEGYEQGKTNSNNHMSLDRFIAGDGVYGDGSYALQLADYLQGLGYDVNHTKLAVSALRAEDLLYLLNGGAEGEHHDDWFDEVVYYSTGAYDYSVVPALSAHYQNAVKNADVITLGIGNASFGAFMLSRMTSALGVMGGSLDDDQLEMYTLENALAMLENEEDEAKVLELYNKFYGELLNYVDAETVEQFKLETISEIFAYVVAGFLVSYSKVIDRIVEINESENLEIMLIGLMNTTYGMKIALDEETIIPFGDIMDEMFGLLNAYIAAYPTAQQAAGNYKGVTFYYAENTQPDFIVNALPELKNEGWTNTDGGRLSADIIRSRTISTFNGALAPMISMGFVAGINAVIEGQVQAGVDAAFPAQYAATVEAGVLAGFREAFGVEPEMMDDATFKAYIYDNGYGDMFDDAYNSAYDANYQSAYDMVLQQQLDANLLPYDYALLPSITLADVKAYEANTPASWNNEYFFMDDTDRKNLAIAVYLGIEDAIVESVDLEEIPVSGLMTIIGDLMSVFDGFAPSIASPEAVHADIATFFSDESMLPLIKIFAIFKIGDGMCVHPTPTGHDATYEAIVESYENNWTAQKQTIKNVYDYVVEYYDEAYAFGYQYADENGYIDLSVNAIDEAIKAIYVAIDEVNAGLLGVTDELKAELVKELYATIETLKELREVLATDSAKDVEGLVATIFALEDDLYTHLNNIYGILAQAGIDVNQLVILPALEEAIRILNEVVIPQVKATAEAIVEAIVEQIKKQVNIVCEKLLGYANELYCEIIATLVRIQLHVQEKIENAIAPIIDAYLTLVDVLTEIYGTVEEAIRIAAIIFNKLVELDAKLNGALSKAMNKVVDLFITLIKTYGSIEKALLALNDILLNIVNTIDGTIESVIAAYNALINKLYAVYGNIEAAILKAHEIYNNIVATVKGAIAEAIELYNAILEFVINTYGTIENAIIVAGQIFSYVYDFAVNHYTTFETMFNDIVAIIIDTYGATQDAYYVASQVYAYLMNALSHTFEGNYVVDEDSMYVSLGDAVYGEDLAEMLGLSDKYFAFDLTDDYLEAIAGADLITIRLDNGEALAFAIGQLYAPEALDWDKYLDAEGKEALDEILAGIKAELLANGKAEELAGVISEQAGLPGISLTPEIVAELIAYTIECTLYSYAEYIDRLTVVLDNVYTVAPDATVVITGIQNPLEGLDLSMLGLDVDLGEYAKAVDFVVAGLNVQLVAIAFANENTIFVNSTDAADIYDALNVTFAIDQPETCNHVYSDCFDTTCNLCGAVRVAPGHSFTNYVYNNDAACEKNGTETAKCDNCNSTSTREVPGTALEHDWSDWVVTKEATAGEDGSREHTCKLCGKVVTEVIPALPAEQPKVSVWIIVAVVGLFGACILVKKNPFKKGDKKEAKTNKK